MQDKYTELRNRVQPRVALKSALLGTAMFSASLLMSTGAHAQAAYQLNGQVQPGTQNGPGISSTVDPTAGIYFGTKRTGITQHLEAGLSAGSTNTPVVSTCSTGALTAGSTDTAGEVTATGATACTLTFGTTYATVPSCTISDETTAAALKIATTASAFTVTGLTSGDKFAYICIAKNGG